MSLCTDSPTIRPAYLSLGSAELHRRELRRYADAERDARRAIELLQSQAQPGEPNAAIGLAYLSLAQALKAEGQTDDAQRAFAAASEQLEPSLGPDHAATRQARALAAGT
jgi:tetratricopeptide (TPR) repeat protein